MSPAADSHGEGGDPGLRPTDDRVTELVAWCLERADQGELETALAEIADAHAEHYESVRRNVETARLLPALIRSKPSASSWVGTVVADRYSIEERIGAGAMGVVYRATDLDLGRTVALKVLRAAFLDPAEALARFEREAETLARVDHSSIVRILDRGVTEDGSPLLVMEYIDGVSCVDLLEAASDRGAAHDDARWLAERFGIDLRGEKSLVRLSAEWAAELADGLQAAHDAGVFHRDVKPSNVVIRRDGRAALIDFGIAAQETHATLTQEGSAVGTPAYMAPESLALRVKAHPSLDVYGLAATLYHLQTLQAPYEGSPTQVMAAVASREPKPAAAVRPGIPRDMQAILDHGMERQPSRRYPSARAMETDLRAFLSYRPVSVRPVTPFARALRRFRRSRAAQIAAVLALLLGAAMVAYLAHAANVEAKARRFAAPGAYPSVPPNLGIVSRPFRRMQDEIKRAAAREVLDEVVASGHDPITGRMLRAIFAYDHGEYAPASEDMNALSDRLGTPFARELAERYAEAIALPPSDMAAEPVAVTGLPEPTTPLGAYVAAMHKVRVKDFGGVEEALTRGALADVRHAQDMLLLFGTQDATTERRKEVPDEDLVYRYAELAANRLLENERRFGYRSAHSAHALSAVRLIQRRYVDALDAAESGLALSRSSHVTLINAASAARELGRWDLSLEYAREGLRLNPGYDKLQVSVYESQMHLGRYEEALATLERTAFAEGETGVSQRRTAEAWIHLEEAIRQLDEDADASIKAAAKAIATVDAAEDPTMSQTLTRSRARALLSGKPEELRRTYLEELLDSPTSVSRLSAVQGLWSTELTPEERALIRRWFDALIEELSRPSRVSGSIVE